MLEEACGELDLRFQPGERIMTSCEQYQAQLLASMYDLLEEAERDSLQAHLVQCAGCQAALTQAQAHKRLLGLAAKTQFPAVRFEPPAGEPPAQEPATVPVPRRARTFALRWALAASILLAVGLSFPCGWWTVIYFQDQRLAALETQRLEATKAQESAVNAQYGEKLAVLQRSVEKIEKDMGDLVRRDEQMHLDLENKVRQQQMDLLVSGPQHLQPGAPNTFRVQTQNLDNQAVPANLKARVVNSRNQVLYETKEVASAGDFQLVLPPSLPLPPKDVLTLEIDASRGGQPTGQVREVLPLATPVFVTDLRTDKPMYRPGETVRFRSLTLERFSLKPAKEPLHLFYSITSPNGEEVFQSEGSALLQDPKTNRPIQGPDKKPIQGVGTGEFVIEPTLPGGEYTLTVREQNRRCPEQQRKFIVNRYENPRLNKELDFTRKSYGAGQEVVAACKVARAEGGTPVANRRVEASIYIDGKPYGADGKEGARPIVMQTDQAGAVNVRFKLPTVIDRGLGTFSVQFSDGASVETLVRPIPIVVKKLQVEFFPEGGDLVAALPNRVYFQARTMLDKPAEIRGRIVDQTGAVVVPNVQTLNDDRAPGVNQGMGLYTFTPLAGRKYELKIDEPAGIEGTYELPSAKDDGIALTIRTGVTKEKEPIRLMLASAQKDRSLLVGAYCRGRLMDNRLVVVKKMQPIEVVLRPVQEAGGVYRVTVFEMQPGNANHPQLTPLAERLVYRVPAKQLVLSAGPDKERYVPGEKVKLSIAGLNEKEQPAPAIAMVAVVDKSVITMADEKTAHTLPTHFYLSTEIRRPEDLEYADFLLSPHPKAPAALDLLLGTQGWRRFAEQNPGNFQQQFGQDADRLLLANGQTLQQMTPMMEREADKIESEHREQLAKLKEEENAARRSLVQIQAERQQEMQRMSLQTVAARSSYQEAVDRLAAHKALPRELIHKAIGPVIVAVAGALLFFLIVAVRRSMTGAIPHLVAAGVCGVLLVGLTVVWSRKPAADNATFAVAGATRDSSLPEASAKSKMVPAEKREELMPVPQAFPAPAPAQPEGLGVPRRGPGGFKFGMPPNPVAGENQVGKTAAAAMRERGMAENQARLFDKQDNAKQNDRAAGMMKGQTAALDARKGLALRRPADLGMYQLAPAGNVGDLKKNLELKAPALPQNAPVMAGAAMRPQMQGQRQEQMGREGGQGRSLRSRLGAKRVYQPPPPPFVVREYAHRRPLGSDSEQRSDFVDTLYWQPALVLANGKTEISFDLCDSVTTCQVVIFGHTLDGQLGAVMKDIEARLPFTLEPKLPIEVTASDKIDVPVSIANNTDQRRQVHLHLAATGAIPVGDDDATLTVDADGRARRLFRLQPSLIEGQAAVQIEGKSEPFADRVTRTFQVVPDGFPIVGSHSEVLERIASHDIVLPESWVKGSLRCKVQAYPSTLADLQKGIESLLREPCGCFEQTSSSNYPNVLALDYLKQSDQSKPELERRARDLLASGYVKLTSFECQSTSSNKRQGYEWFGGTAPPHEALTAYGLLEFRDMARVYDVDPRMIERTRVYLMSRKDGKGGFQRNTRALDSFGRAPDDITNAYIVWALTESGKDDDVRLELATLAGQAKTSKDPYFLALVATSLINRGQTEEGTTLLKRVAVAQQADGHLDAAHTSITGSGGRDLQIETTALAVLGWLKANRPGEFNAPLQKAIRWIGQQRGGYGGFGSTQSTILALKALIAFANANKKTVESGALRLSVGNQIVANLDFAAGAQEALLLTMPDAEKQLKAGKNTVGIEITGKNIFPYTLSWSYQTLKPANPSDYPVRLQTRLDRAQASEGEPVHLTVIVENTQDKGQGMAVAIIGLPAGLTLPEDMKQLKDHARLRNDGTEKGLISAWETRGREVILYWRDLAPRQKIEVPLDIICRVPGEYSGPASRAYLYYNADLKHWVEPLHMTIQAKMER